MSHREKTDDKKAPKNDIEKAADALDAAVKTFECNVGERAVTDAIEVIKHRVDFHRIRDCVRINKAGSA